MSTKIELGDTAKDIITGYKGVVVSRTDWLWACTRFGIQSKKLKDGQPTDAQWFDEHQLEIVEKGTVDVSMFKNKTNPKDKGGPQDDPSSSCTVETG